MATNLEQPTAPDVAKSLLFEPGGLGSLAPAPKPAASSASIASAVGPIVFVLALLTLATAYSGAFDVRQWAPPTLFVLLLILSLLLRGGVRPLPDRWLALSLGGIWGLACWAALSAGWAASPGAALQGAGQLVMYAAIMTLSLAVITDMRALGVAGRGAVGGIALIALYTLARMLLDGPSVFLAGRLNDPVGYRNATALLFCLAYWPLIVTAATRGRGRALRAGCLGLAELMLGLAFLTQSRGVVLGLGCGALVALTVGGERVRRAWLALLSVVLLAAFSVALLRPYHAFAGGEGLVKAADIAVAARALLGLVGVGVVAGFLLAVFDTGLRPASPAMGRVRAAARVGLVAALLGGIAGGLVAAHGDPLGEARAKWREFKSLQTTSTSTTRYSSTGGQRYDLWRVALLELRSAPVLGVGEGSYEFTYYRLRRTNRNLNDPHGLLFQLGSELGLVGLALFAAILVGLVGSVRRWWPLAPARARRSACGLGAAGATFIGQSLVDWMWRIPGLTALGLLCLSLAAAILARSTLAGAGATTEPGPRSERVSGAARVLRASVWGRVAAGAVLLASIALVLSLYLSDVYIRRARAEIGRSPTIQLARARTAARFDPWSLDARYLESSALESMGKRSAAIAQLQDAQRLEPANEVPLGLLGDFEARAAHYVRARSYYRAALALDPLDVGLQQLARSGGRTEGG